MAGKKKKGSEYARTTPTAEIKEDLEAHEEIEDPGALAAWLRRKGLGMSKSEFAKYGAEKRKRGE